MCAKVCLIMLEGPMPKLEVGIVLGKPEDGMVTLADSVVWDKVATTKIPAGACWQFDADLLRVVNGLVTGAIDAIDAAAAFMATNGRPAFIVETEDTDTGTRH
jgi:hypothetical protein